MNHIPLKTANMDTKISKQENLITEQMHTVVCTRLKMNTSMAVFSSSCIFIGHLLETRIFWLFGGPGGSINNQNN